MIQFLSGLNINTLIIVIGALAITYNQYRNNRSQVSREVIENYKEQVEQLKDKITGFELKINELTQKVGHQDGIISEKEKQIKSYEAILQNRNPELEKILVNVVDFMKRIEGHMEFSGRELKKQTVMLEKNQ